MSSDVKSWRSKRRSLTTLTHAVAAMLLVLAGLLGVSQPTSAADGDFVNLSTRAYVGTGDEVMIGGFIIEGGSRQVLIQARGPELASAGVANALADPVLRVIDTSDPADVRELMFNDNWEDSQGQLVSDLWGGSPNMTAGGLSSAAVLTLEPGNYTAIVEGKNGTAGVAIVEVYDIDSAGANGRFVNLSTRSFVETGDEVMIGGFIIRDGPKTVLVQARGTELANDVPSLTGLLADPVLSIISNDTGEELMFNDNWEDSQGQGITEAWNGSPNLMTGSLSAAAVITLDPGNYTAIVRGKNATTGLAQVEVYDLDPPGSGSPDREALMALYNVTGGVNWTNSDNWSSDAPFGDWHGVTVDENGRVIELSLMGNELSGPIPAELGDLANLQLLHLGNNELSGGIPSELGNLANLRVLELGDNQLTGPIPPELENLTNLTRLRLGGNELSGQIPAWLSGLANLEDLGLSRNQLTGAIPTELGNLSNLQYLSLPHNQLSGSIPAELGNLLNLKELYLGGNALTGPIPAELGSLAGLERLELFENQLSGSIPPELGSLGNLTVLFLYSNQLSGVIPPELGNLSNLVGLVLYSNQLSGVIPLELGSLSNLTVLFLINNQLSGFIPVELGNLINLRTLGLTVNQLSGSIPVELGNLPNLRTLDLNVNQLSGSIPPELGSLSNLTRLDLSGNQLSGVIPVELGNLANLERLELWGNQLSGPIPPELGSLANLGRLELWVNRLTGSIPPELGSLSNLTVLHLSSNQLSGVIPPELGNLANLVYLSLWRNQLSGSIPDSFLELSNLEAFQFTDNDGLCAPNTSAFTSWLQGITEWSGPRCN